MSKTNRDTIQTYQEHVDEYISRTVKSSALHTWLRKTVAPYSHDAKIFEIGSGSGYDAEYIESMGYRVQTSDATQAFVDYLRNHGHDAMYWNVLEDNLPNRYDIILADAVFLHLTKPEAEAGIDKVFNSLRPGGTFSFTLKEGVGEEWSNHKLGSARYFCYWQQDEIDEVLRNTGFTPVDIVKSIGARGVAWLEIIARRQDR